MNITVDPKKCDGHEKCVQAAPGVFKMNERFVAEVSDPKGDTDEKIILAAKNLPYQGHYGGRRQRQASGAGGVGERGISDFEISNFGFSGFGEELP